MIHFIAIFIFFFVLIMNSVVKLGIIIVCVMFIVILIFNLQIDFRILDESIEYFICDSNHF